MNRRRLPTHIDERGRLLVAEDADLGFPVRRVFAVTAVPEGTTRGDHVVPCRMAMVLILGGATVWTAPAEGGATTRHALEQPGDALDLSAGEWVRYALAGPDSVVLVLAEQPYRGRAS